MDLNEFIIEYNKKDVVILLAGKINVLPGDEDKIFNLGKILAK